VLVGLVKVVVVKKKRADWSEYHYVFLISVIVK
jgi:hypothetical protein